jgi:hypothetical protein
MFEFLMITLATFTVVMFVLGLLPFRIPGKLMPLALTAAGYGCMKLYGRWPDETEAAAVAGGVALVSRYAVTQLPEPWKLDDVLGRAFEVVPKRQPVRRPPRLTEVAKVSRARADLPEYIPRL